MDEAVIITPLGWERDRASQIAMALKVHRVVLLYQPGFPDTQRHAEAVTRDLEGADIEVETVELVGPEATREFDWLVFHIARSIVDESEEGNIVYVNMSSGSKIAAAAATIAAMFHREKVKNLLYVVPSKYSIQDENPGPTFHEHGLGVGMAGRQFVPLFHIERPPDAVLEAVVALYEGGPLSYGDLLGVLQASGHGAFEKVKIAPLDEPIARKRDISKWTARLRRHVIEPAENVYLRVAPSHKGPEKVVEITPAGQYLALLSGRATALK